ncbi:MAG: FKBP-type peptidyl-prolyl cis-trans isomerase [Puia sp.]|nr:FKBP-type peptidyl-prolyl cis-trans isomerase [Puia sp.]
MKIISSYLLVALTLLAAVSCNNQGYKKTKSGLQYKIISDGKGDLVKRGQWLKVSVLQKLRDSVLYSSEGSVPAYIRVDSVRGDYNPAEVFPLLRKGDSVIIVELADTLQRKFGQLPPFIKKKDKIIIALKVYDVFTTDEQKANDLTAEITKEKAREITTMEDYLAKNKINATKTAKGTYVVVDSVGDGPAVDSGKQVFVRYTGKLFPSGKVFESNMSGPGNAPFPFVVGAGQIIPGWDDGLRLFKKGGKGSLYIPAFLAYDQAPRGPSHKPFENLMFDIEIVDVKDAPKEAPRPAMNMPNMPGRPMPGRPMPGGRPMPSTPPAGSGNTPQH